MKKSMHSAYNIPMNTIEAIKTKRAVRIFSDQAVPDDIIRQILDAGRRSQSSMNQQPWQFIVVRDRETLLRLGATSPNVGHIKGAAFAVVIATSTDWEFDTGQAAAYLQLAAWDLGVSSCIAMSREPDQVRAILGVPAGWNCGVALSFGYAAQPPGQPKPTGRKGFEEVVRWEHW